MNRSKEACHCRNVTYGMIEEAIKNGAETLQEVQDATGAAKGCGQCKDFLMCLIRDIKEELKVVENERCLAAEGQEDKRKSEKTVRRYVERRET